MIQRVICIIAAIAFLNQQNANAQIRLPRLVRDSMVLQRDAKINIWGWAAPKEKVTIKFHTKNYKATTGEDGKWTIQLPPTKAGGPYIMEIAGSNKIALKDILIGDVWMCSGQSNMVHQMNIHDVLYAKDITEANNPQIRHFWIPTLTNIRRPQEDLPTGFWKSAIGDDVRPFSAVAYFFAKKIYEKYHIPIGLINASVGGTPIEAWISEEGVKDFPNLASIAKRNKDTAYINSLSRGLGGNFTRPQQNDLGLLSEKKWFDVSYVPKCCIVQKRN